MKLSNHASRWLTLLRSCFLLLFIPLTGASGGVPPRTALVAPETDRHLTEPLVAHGHTIHTITPKTHRSSNPLLRPDGSPLYDQLIYVTGPDHATRTKSTSAAAFPLSVREVTDYVDGGGHVLLTTDSPEVSLTHVALAQALGVTLDHVPTHASLPRFALPETTTKSVSSSSSSPSSSSSSSLSSPLTPVPVAGACRVDMTPTLHAGRLEPYGVPLVLDRPAGDPDLDQISPTSPSSSPSTIVPPPPPPYLVCGVEGRNGARVVVYSIPHSVLAHHSPSLVDSVLSWWSRRTYAVTMDPLDVQIQGGKPPRGGAAPERRVRKDDLVVIETTIRGDVAPVDANLGLSQLGVSQEIPLTVIPEAEGWRCRGVWRVPPTGIRGNYTLALTARVVGGGIVEQTVEVTVDASRATDLQPRYATDSWGGRGGLPRGGLGPC